MSAAEPSGDADIEAFRAAQKAASRRAVARVVKFLIVAAVALLGGGGVFVTIANWEEAQNRDRLARYQRGEVVYARRSERIDQTGTSVTLPLIAGLGTAVVLFAVGSAIVLRDRTYLRALGDLAR